MCLVKMYVHEVFDSTAVLACLNSKVYDSGSLIFSKLNFLWPSITEFFCVFSADRVYLVSLAFDF